MLKYGDKQRNMKTIIQQHGKVLRNYPPISSVYSLFSNRVGLPHRNNPPSGVLMKTIGVEFLQLDALPGVNHMHGMQYQIVLNIICFYIYSYPPPSFNSEKYNTLYIYIYILSVYSPFSDRVGLPLHNIHIPSPFTSIMDIFFADLKFGYIRFYTL